jgi:hypothetical protein
MASSKELEMADRRRLAGSTTTITRDNPPTTFHALANLDNSLGGRFATGGDVSGSEEVTRYPRLPSNSPWAGSTRVPDEPPLGFEIDRLDNVTGEFFEVQASSGFLPLPDDGTPAPTIRGSVGAGAASSELARGLAPSPRSSLRSDVETSSSHPLSGKISRAELDDLLGRLVVPKEK